MTSPGVTTRANLSGRRAKRSSRLAAADAIDEAPLLTLVSLSDWYRFVPETLVVLLLIEGADRLLPGLTVGGTMSHPFWIAVLLMSGQYGIMGGLFATLAATGAMFLGGLPPQSATQDFYAYAGVVAAQPCAWLATALVMGGLRTRHIHFQTELEEQLRHAQLVADGLAAGLQRASDEIGRLEHRIAADSTTLTSLLRSLDRLDLTDVRSLVGSVGDLVRYGVGAVSFTVCLRDNDGLDTCLSVEDGVRVAPSAALPYAIHKALPSGRADPQSDINVEDGFLMLGTICLPDTTHPAGVIVCSRLERAHNRALAARRLDEICHLIASLLPWCSDNRISTAKS